MIGRLLKQFVVSVGLHVSLVTFRDVLNIGLRGHISGSFCAPKSNICQVVNHFLENIPLVSHAFCFTCLLGVCLGVFQSVFSLVAELVKPSGLLLFDLIFQLFNWLDKGHSPWKCITFVTFLHATTCSDNNVTTSEYNWCVTVQFWDKHDFYSYCYPPQHRALFLELYIPLHAAIEP